MECSLLGGVADADITLATAASCTLGILMYWRKTALCHRPRSWIVESSTLAEVAAPIRKLCPAYWCWGRPIISLTRPTNQAYAFSPCVREEWAWFRASQAIYSRLAVTGQRGLPVWPRMMSAPLRTGRTWIFFRWTCTIVVAAWSSTSTAMPPRQGELLHWRSPLNPATVLPTWRTRRRLCTR